MSVLPSGVAFTAKMVSPKAAAQGAFYFQKIFGDGDYLASGILMIPPNSTKPTKSTKDNTFVRIYTSGFALVCGVELTDMCCC